MRPLITVAREFAAAHRKADPETTSIKFFPAAPQSEIRLLEGVYQEIAAFRGLPCRGVIHHAPGNAHMGRDESRPYFHKAGISKMRSIFDRLRTNYQRSFIETFYYTEISLSCNAMHMIRQRMKIWILVIAWLTLFGCSKDAPDVSKEPPVPAASNTKQAARIEWIKAPAGEDAATVVKRELDRAHVDKKRLLVYVGATWCEPCKRFHDAAEAGQIDGVFPNLRLVEFDLDVDGDRLAAAGYASKMIPLFAVPTENGTASDKRIEGSVKGEGAVMNLRTRLQSLLEP